jgi:formamidopyrimidine-DNA glycosylase
MSMPELPEVEVAVRRLRAAVEGRTILRARVMHPSLRARMPARRARSLVGARVSRVERRGKHQLLHLDDGRVVHAHFRMSGDWHVDRDNGPEPRFARAVVELDDGARVMLQGLAEDAGGFAIGDDVELVLRRYAVERGAPVYGYKVKRKGS